MGTNCYVVTTSDDQIFIFKECTLEEIGTGFVIRKSNGATQAIFREYKSVIAYKNYQQYLEMIGVIMRG